MGCTGASRRRRRWFRSDFGRLRRALLLDWPDPCCWRCRWRKFFDRCRKALYDDQQDRDSNNEHVDSSHRQSLSGIADGSNSFLAIHFRANYKSTFARQFFTEQLRPARHIRAFGQIRTLADFRDFRCGLRPRVDARNHSDCRA